MSWELLAGPLHVSGTGQRSLAAGIEWQLFSADPCASEQHYLVTALLTSIGERPRKGGLNIAHSVSVPGQETAPVGTFHYAVEKQKQYHLE